MFRGQLCLLVCLYASAQQKELKDAREYELYNAVAKDFAAKTSAKALADLDAWKKAYPESVFRVEREWMYVQAYAEANQPEAALATSSALLSSGAALDASALLRVLFTSVTAFRQIGSPSADQMAFAESAALRLEKVEKPDNVTPDAWSQASNVFRTAAADTLLYIEISRSASAKARNDCPEAEAAARRAIDIYPDSIQAAWYLGLAELCQQKTEPNRALAAIWEFARAATIDPAKGKADAKWQKEIAAPNLAKIYTQYHGEDAEGLARLKEMSLSSPTPPADFNILSAQEIEQQKRAAFETKFPEIALWMRIKAQLSAPGGEDYFASGLKGAELPRLRGVVVDAKPSCRPSQLFIAVKTPDATDVGLAEIALKLDKPVAGSVAVGTDVVFEGVPVAFSSNPFLLTISVDPRKVDGLSIHACSAGKK